VAKKKVVAKIRKALLSRQLTEPVFVSRKEYERALDSSLRAFERGLSELDAVKGALAKAAAKVRGPKDKRALKLAIEKVDDSIAAFGWDQLPYQYRSKKRMMIWPAAARRKS
jgi:exonuclease VII small subunit